ncbi:alpha/beta hydrolase [Chitinophaga vietnamensis]|uniref:alpha/beta hydrolase n=1 Tax=Chitinophaga vietnamensis TaxID=2593957 RepID=UPI001178B02A|nr:alpha/beta fold hydrolase [Chitinophaga vietnamensis]
MQHQVLPLSFRVTALLLSGMSRPFPVTTARMFFRLYCTPPAKKKLRASQLEWRNAATVAQIQVSSYPFDDTPFSIATYRWGSSPKKILLHHGWGGSPLHFRQLITMLVNNGYEVISYDAPAHGSSGGRRTNLVQWMHVLAQMIEREGPLYAVIGHSLGGLTAALTLARRELQVPKLVMLSCALSAPVFFNETFRLFRIDPVVMPHVQKIIRKRLHEDLDSMDLHRYINGIHADRIWMAYDTTDTLVSATEVDDFLQRYPAIESMKFSGDGHFRIMRHEGVLNGILQFLA